MKLSTRPLRTLLCVTGLSPQVVTETLYALAVAQQPAWIPDEVHIVTTQHVGTISVSVIVHNQGDTFA